MLKKIFKLIKKIVISSFLLYGYNIVIKPTKIFIPINIFTVSILTLFDIPGLLSLILIYLLIY